MAKKGEITSIFAHGIASNKYQARAFAKKFYKSDGSLYYNDRHILPEPFITFDFPDSAYYNDHQEKDTALLPIQKIVRRILRGNYLHTSLAQENEITHLQEIIAHTITDYDGIIFSGVSRGASIFFTWAGHHDHSAIVAAVLESPFAQMEDVIEHVIAQCSMDRFITVEQGQGIIEFLFRKYKRTGPHPIDYITVVSKDIPILIVASTSDHLVPWHSSFKLYKKMRSIGHTKVHFLLLKKGRHGFLITGPEGKKYQKTVHAFYKKYNLPHDAQLAAEGEPYFEECTPSWE